MIYRQTIKQLVVFVCLFAYAAQLFAGGLHMLPPAASKAMFEADSALTHDSLASDVAVSPCHGAAREASQAIELASSKLQTESDTCCAKNCQMQGCHTSPALVELFKSLLISSSTQLFFFYQEQALSQALSSLYRPPHYRLIQDSYA